MSTIYRDKFEIYIISNHGEFISPKIEVWLADKEEYLEPCLEHFLADIVIHCIYRLYKTHKLDRVKIEDAYINRIDNPTGEISPVVSYLDFDSMFPDKDVIPDMYSCPILCDDNMYMSMFDIRDSVNSIDRTDKISRRFILDKPLCEFDGGKADKLLAAFSYRTTTSNTDYLRYYIGRYIPFAVCPYASNGKIEPDYIYKLNEWLDSL